MATWAYHVHKAGPTCQDLVGPVRGRRARGVEAPTLAVTANRYPCTAHHDFLLLVVSDVNKHDAASGLFLRAGRGSSIRGAVSGPACSNPWWAAPLSSHYLRANTSPQSQTPFLMPLSPRSFFSILLLCLQYGPLQPILTALVRH